MTTTATTTRKHTRPEDGFTSDPRAWFDLFSDSLNDPIPVANAAARTAMLAALALRTPAITPAATKPILFEQQDLPAGYRYLYTVDGANFISLSGLFVWADAAARTASTTMADGDFGYQIDTKVKYCHVAGAWKEWESGWLTDTPTLANITLGTGSSTVYRKRFIGGVCEVDWYIKLGTGGTVGTFPTISLPVNHEALRHPYQALMSEVSYYDDSAPANIPWRGSVAANNTDVDKVRLYSTNTGALVNLNSASPLFGAAFAINDVIHVRASFIPA